MQARDHSPRRTPTSGEVAYAIRPRPTLVQRTLFALEEDWTHAFVGRDGATFDRLLAPSFVYTENDQVMTKEGLIRAVMRGRGASGPFDRRFRYTDTWHYRDGRWQVIGAHDYLVPERR